MQVRETQRPLEISFLEHGTVPSESDLYELLQYYTAKLETRKTRVDIYTFLLEFIGTVIAQHQGVAPASIYLVDDKDLGFTHFVSNRAPVEHPIFIEELDEQIDTGIVAWCITNRRSAFAPTRSKNFSDNCILIPISTIEHTLGFALVYTSAKVTELSQVSLQVISLACTQTALYADNIAILRDLTNAQSNLIFTEKLSAIGQLAAGVAHEINNPIAFVLGNSEILKKYWVVITEYIRFCEEQQLGDVVKIKRDELDIEAVFTDIDDIMSSNIGGLNRIVEIVSNLKDFARFDQRQIVAPANLEENIKKMLLVARNETKYVAEENLEFCSLPLVNCNINQISQVILDLIVNAAQAIKECVPKRKGLITIRTRLDESYCCCDIIDNGAGIAPNILPYIFDPFFTTKPLGQGTGLGLNIAYDIIKNKHHGELSVISELHMGSCFTIRLPLHRQAVE